MLGDRHELDVREAHARARTRASGVRDLAVAEEPLGIRRDRAATSPGAPRRSTSARRARWRVRATRIHSPSFHVVVERSQSTEAVRGGSSAAERERIGLVDLVAAHAATRCGTCSAGPRDAGHDALPRCPSRRLAERAGGHRRRQPLKSPITLTPHGVGRPHGEARRLAAADDVRAELARRACDAGPA